MLSCPSFVKPEKERSHGCSDIPAKFADSQSHTWNNDTCNLQRAGSPRHCHEVQGLHRSKDEGPMSQEPTRAGHLSSSPHDNKYANLTSFQARTLPPIHSPISTSASRNAFQRVQAAPKFPVRASLPSQQPDQRSSRPISVQSLLNPIKAEDHINASNAPSTLLEKTTGPPGFTKSHVPALPSARPLPQRQLSQEPAHSQAQNCERAVTIKPASPQLAFQSDSPGTQYSAYGQVSHTEPTMAPSAALTSQPQSSFSNSFPSPGPASTMSQEAFGTEGQYRMMTLETGNGPLQVPLDVQAASKVTSEKRNHNATASHHFRRRRKAKERETNGCRSRTNPRRTTQDHV